MCMSTSVPTQQQLLADTRGAYDRILKHPTDDEIDRLTGNTNVIDPNEL